eukprot:gene8829-9008_t
MFAKTIASTHGRLSASAHGGRAFLPRTVRAAPRATLSVLTILSKAQQQLQSENLVLTFTVRRRRIASKQGRPAQPRSPADDQEHEGQENATAAAAAVEQPDEAAPVAGTQEDQALVTAYVVRATATPAAVLQDNADGKHQHPMRVNHLTEDSKICSHGLRAIENGRMPVSFAISGRYLQSKASVLLRSLSKLSYDAWGNHSTRIKFSVTREFRSNGRRLLGGGTVSTAALHRLFVTLAMAK